MGYVGVAAGFLRVDAVDVAAIAGGGEQGAIAPGEGVGELFAQGDEARGSAVGGNAVDLGAVGNESVGGCREGGVGLEEGDGDAGLAGGREWRQRGWAAVADCGEVKVAGPVKGEGGDFVLGGGVKGEGLVVGPLRIAVQRDAVNDAAAVGAGVEGVVVGAEEQGTNVLVAGGEEQFGF